MAEDTNVIVDEIKFFFTYQGKRYMAYAYALNKEEHDLYGCIITDEHENNKEVGFYFDSCGGMTEDIPDIAQVVLDIIFNNIGMIREF